MIEWSKKVESTGGVWRGINKGDSIELRKTFTNHPNFAQVLIVVTDTEVVMSMNGKASMSVEDIVEIGEVVKEARNTLSDVKRYVWLNIATGEFSNSWGEEDHLRLNKEEIARAVVDGWKLIEYKCVNDGNFNFSIPMKIK